MKKIFTLILLSIFAFSFASNNTNEKLTCPTASATVSSSTICSGETTGIALTSNVAGTTYTWQVVANNLFGASSGSGNAINQTLTVVNRNYSGTVDYIITPFADNCTGTPIQVTITVNPKPEIFGTTVPQYLCSGHSSNITIAPYTPGTSVSWTVVQNGVTGASNGSGTETTPGAGIPINQILTTIGNNPGTATYTITPSLNGCPGTPITITFIVNPIPTVTVNSPTVCNGSSATVTATPATSGTYRYAWTVPAGVPNPGNVASFSTTTAGTYSVVTTNTDTGCPSASASGVVTVNPAAGSFNVICGPSNSAGHPGEIYIDWSNVVGITNFNYSYSINGGPVVTGSQSAPSSMYITNNNQPVTFTLSGTGTVCVAPVTITCGTLSTDENNIDDFVISPNPVTNILNIKNNQTINKVTAFNQLGQIVLQKEFNSNEVQLDFSALKTGIYFISVDSDTKQSTFKIVKQ